MFIAESNIFKIIEFSFFLFTCGGMSIAAVIKNFGMRRAPLIVFLGASVGWFFWRDRIVEIRAMFAPSPEVHQALAPEPVRPAPKQEVADQIPKPVVIPSRILNNDAPVEMPKPYRIPKRRDAQVRVATKVPAVAVGDCMLSNGKIISTGSPSACHSYEAGALYSP